MSLFYMTFFLTLNLNIITSSLFSVIICLCLLHSQIWITSSYVLETMSDPCRVEVC
jgi:hypothetical protein